MLNVNETVTSIKPCYKIRYLSLKIWRYAESRKRLRDSI